MSDKYYIANEENLDKTIDLTVTPSKEEIKAVEEFVEKATFQVEEVYEKDSLQKGQHNRAVNYQKQMFPESILSHIEELLGQAKWISETYPKVIAEIQKPDSPFSDYDIRNITLEQLADVLNSIEGQGEGTQALDIIPQLSALSVSDVNYPVDKPNNEVWHLLETNSTNGQLTLGFNVAPRKSRKKIPEALIFYSIKFDEDLPVSISKKLTTFDKRVYIATSALYNAGNEYITTNQIYKLIGGQNNRNQNDSQKILNSLIKMAGAWVILDNTNEASVLKREKQIHAGHLLDAEFNITISLNGKITNDAIKILREPRLITFAKERKQYTTISQKVFALPLSNTDKNLDIKDYILTNLAGIKSKHLRNKMLWESIYEHCHITRNKDRARADVIKCLDYLKSDNGDHYIKDYAVSDDGITIYFEK